MKNPFKNKAARAAMVAAIAEPPTFAMELGGHCGGVKLDNTGVSVRFYGHSFSSMTWCTLPLNPEILRLYAAAISVAASKLEAAERKGL